MKLLAPVCAALIAAFTLPAHAFTVDVLDANGNDIDTSWSLVDMLSVDVGLRQGGSITLGIHTDAADDATLAFNAVLRNLVGLGIENLTFSLTGTTFSTLGSASGTFASTAQVSGAGSLAQVRFTGPEYYEAYIGDWLLNGSNTDFSIDLAGATAPITLTITASVPEPSTYAMLLAGLGLAGFAARRRR